MASENEPSAWTHPFSTSDISVYDYQTLLNALKAYCKNTSAKLIFDLDPEEPGLGETRNLDHEKPGPGKKRNLDQTNILNSGKDFYDGLTADDANAITEADHQQWETVKKNIDTFVENPHGSVLKKSLVEDLTDQLKNGQLKNYHGDAPIPEDLYELFIAHQLAWRQDYRAKNNGGRRHSIGHHPDRRGPTFSVTLVMEVANSSAVKTKTIHLSVNITEPSSYFDFLKELRVASQSPQAEEEGFESGYGYEHGPWMFENHDVGEEETLEEFKNFDIDTWERVRGKDIPYLFWHASISSTSLII
jgi:hypothetical protein